MTGKVKTLIKEKKFGFIARDGEEKDLFFHMKNLSDGLEFDDLKEGDMLSFDVKQGEKGPNAVNVTRG